MLIIVNKFNLQKIFANYYVAYTCLLVCAGALIIMINNRPQVILIINEFNINKLLDEYFACVGLLVLVTCHVKPQMNRYLFPIVFESLGPISQAVTKFMTDGQVRDFW